MSEEIGFRKVTVEPTPAEIIKNTLYMIDLGGGYFTLKISTLAGDALHTLYTGGATPILGDTFQSVDYAYNETNVLISSTTTFDNGVLEYVYVYTETGNIDTIQVSDTRVPESFNLVFEYDTNNGNLSRIYKTIPQT